MLNRLTERIYRTFADPELVEESALLYFWRQNGKELPKLEIWRALRYALCSAVIVALLATQPLFSILWGILPEMAPQWGILIVPAIFVSSFLLYTGLSLLILSKPRFFWALERLAGFVGLSKKELLQQGEADLHKLARTSLDELAEEILMIEFPGNYPIGYKLFLEEAQYREKRFKDLYAIWNSFGLVPVAGGAFHDRMAAKVGS